MTRPGIAADDPAAKAFPFTPWSLVQKPLPDEVRERLEGWPVSTFQARALDALGQHGFFATDNSPLDLTRAAKPGHPPKKLTGTLVGERNLQLDVALRHTASVRMAVLAGLGVVGIILAVVLVSVPGLWFVVGPLLAGSGLAGVMITVTGRGAYDSEVAYVIYETSPSVTPGQPLTADTPLTLDARIGAARISSVNWASKTGSGRSFKAVLPPVTDLRGIPSEVLGRIRG